MNAMPGRSVSAADVDPRDVHWEVEVGRLWSGAIAAMLAALLATFVGLLIIRGLFGLPVLRRSDGTTVEQASTLWYLVAAAVAVAAATLLLQLLLQYAPAPWRFYHWITALVIAAATILPLTFTASTSSKVATALLHLFVLTVVAVWVDLVGRACSTQVVDEAAL